jgi:hypothetical protein
MTWTTVTGLERRAIVVVEDHLYHIGELLAALAAAAPRLAHEIAVVCLDEAGPDTLRSARGWLDDHPGVQVLAALERPGDEVERGPGGRLLALPREAFRAAARLCSAVASTLRPGGMLVQDVQLATLAFLPADRWWDSIFLASTVRGMFGERPPTCRFLSNKRGYEATFGRDLLVAGFDPRDVMDKGDLAGVVAPALHSWFERALPLAVERRLPGGTAPPLRAARDGGERADIEAAFDLVLWRDDEAPALGGRLIAREGQRRQALKPGSHEVRTWDDLLADRLAGGDGVPVTAVGERVAPPGAGRAEITNVAARHVHALRARLCREDAIVTSHHAYRLRDELTLARISPAASLPG